MTLVMRRYRRYFSETHEFILTINLPLKFRVIIDPPHEISLKVL